MKVYDCKYNKNFGIVFINYALFQFQNYIIVVIKKSEIKTY